MLPFWEDGWGCERHQSRWKFQSPRNSWGLSRRPRCRSFLPRGARVCSEKGRRSFPGVGRTAVRAQAGKGPCCWQVLAFGMKLRGSVDWNRGVASLLLHSREPLGWGGGQSTLRGSPEAPSAWPKGEGHSQGAEGVPGGGSQREEPRTALGGGSLWRFVLRWQGCEEARESALISPALRPAGRLQPGPWPALLCKEPLSATQKGRGVTGEFPVLSAYRG